jgi:hypothetical protein
VKRPVPRPLRSRRPPRAGLALCAALAFAAVSWTPSAPRPVHAALSADLVTYGPGDPLYARWGHVSIRLIDPALGLDQVFNYGHAVVEGPGFLWDFIRGEAEYLLVTRSWSDEVERYRRLDRTVVRQPLALSQPALEALARHLFWNARRENRAYRYDHLFDNCATRLRDLLDEATGGAVRRAADASELRSSFRAYSLEAARGLLPMAVGIDLIGGPHQDTPIGAWEAAYVPERLRELLSATRVERDGALVPLAGEPVVVYERQARPALRGSPQRGRLVVLAWGLATALLVVATRLGGSALARLGGLALLGGGAVLGLFGVVLWGLLGTATIPDLVWNESALVYFPTDLALALLGARWLWTGRARVGRLGRTYAGLHVAALLVLAAAHAVGLAEQDNWPFAVQAAAVWVALLWVPRSSGDDTT